jgi:hypothetical protein
MARVLEMPPMARTPEEIYERIRDVLPPHNREQIVAAIAEALACQTCGGQLTSFCPRCRGLAGASKISPKKLRHLKRIAKKKRPGRKKKDITPDQPPAD